MADFQKYFTVFIRENLEGGYVNDPRDSGGETFAGITRRSHPNWEYWSTIDHMKKTGQNPDKLLKDADVMESVAAFYKSRYWDKCNGDKINDQKTANMFCDFVINSGLGMIKRVQAAIGVTPDGLFGAISTARLNEVDMSAQIIYHLRAERFNQAIESKPTNIIYCNGWLRRLNIMMNT